MKKNKTKRKKSSEGEWLPLKEIFKDRKFHLIILSIILLWIILIQIVYSSSGGDFALSSSDGYVILLHARGWYEGHPLSVYPDEPPVPKNPIPYAMLLSIGHWLGFKSQTSFIFWTYLINLIMLLGSSLFLYRFFNRFFPEVAFPSTLLSTLFASIFYNFFSCTTMPLLFLLISGALAFLESLPFFLLFAILAGFCRNEGILYYLFLCSLHIGLNRKNWWKLTAGFLPLLLPFLVNKYLIGQRVTQGTVSQILFHYGSFTNVLEAGTTNFLHHLKATVLGLYRTTEYFGLQSQGSPIFTLPPLFFIFFILGIIDRKKKFLTIPTVIFFLLLILGDSFVLFTGVGNNRHLLSIFPLIFAFSFAGIKRIDKNIKGFFTVAISFFSIFFIVQEIILFISMKKNVESATQGREVAQWLNENLPPETAIFDAMIGSRFINFYADKVRFISLTPNLNPIFGKYIKAFWRQTTMAELIQREYTGVEYLLEVESGKPNNFSFINWLKTFAKDEKRTFSWVGEERSYNLYTLDLSNLKLKRFEENIIDEIDISDPVSEINHEYKRGDASGMNFYQTLQRIEGVYDGGKVTEGYETFYLDISKNEKNELICLFGKKFKGISVDLNPKDVKFNLEEPYYSIFIEGEKITEGKIEKDFQTINIPLPQDIDKDRIKITIKGRFVSYHYWTKIVSLQSKRY